MTRNAQRALLVLLPLAALSAAAWFFLRPGPHGHAGALAEQLYTCGMHPAVIQNKPGNCPICGMKLTPIRKQPGAATASAIVLRARLTVRITWQFAHTSSHFASSSRIASRRRCVTITLISSAF